MPRSAPTCLLVLASAFWMAPTSVGQGIRAMQGAQSGRFIEAPRAVKQQLREAERALEEERYSDAVVRLGDLLAGDTEPLADEELDGQDFFLDIDDLRRDGTPVTASLLRSARDKIADLPAQALETYQLRYGPLAEKLLLQAAADRDWHQVREVRRRYFHTAAGLQASALLAQAEIYAGRPLSASLLLDDVVPLPWAVDQLGPGVVLLHARACRLANRAAPPLDLIAGQDVVVGGKSIAAASIEQLQELVDQSIAQPAQQAGRLTDQYPLFGTAPDRNGGSAGELPLTNKRWDLVTTASPRQERDIRAAADALTSSGKLPPPSWIPIRVGDHLLMRTTERLVGVDYRTGKRVWTYPWQTASEDLDRDEESLDAFEDERTVAALLKQRVWNDVPYGQISSDGRRAYMLDSLGQVQAAMYGPMIQMRGTRPADDHSNTLVALDLETEGKLLWRLGAGVGDGTPLSDAFFLGPPLPLDGRLYVIAELAGDIILVCLAPTTGKELWRQQLLAVESGGIDADPIRRVAGAMPTYRDGIMICPTGAGAIVAIDLADRMIRWGVSFPRNSEMNRSVMVRGRGLEIGQLMQRWFTGTAVVADDTVLVTPIESDRLFGLDLLTGQKRFQQKNRIHMRYLAGARDGKFFVVGSTGMRAFNLHDGGEVWNTPADLLDAGQMISGIGAFGDGEYLLPTTINEIIRVSLADGSVLGRRTTGFPLGNLVAAGGELISQSPTKLSVAFGQQSLEPLVNRMLQDNPDDLDALIRKSELLIEKDQRDEALQLLERAAAIDPENHEIRLLSVSAMLGKLQGSTSVDPDLIASLDAQIDRPSQRIEFLSLLTEVAIGQHDYPEAIRRLIQLSTLLESNPMLESSVKRVSNAPGHYCSLVDWIASNAAQIHQLADAADREAVNRQLREHAEQTRHGSTKLLLNTVRSFGLWSGIDPMRQELRGRLHDDGLVLKQERVTLGTDSPTESALSKMPADRLLALASTYAAGNFSQDALLVLGHLDAADANQDVAAQLRAAANSNRDAVSWSSPVRLDWSSRPTRGVPIRQLPLITVVQAGRQFDGWSLVNDTAAAIALRDPLGHVRRVPVEPTVPRSMPDQQGYINGGFMAVLTPNGLTAIDLFQLSGGGGDSVLWNRTFGTDAVPYARRRVRTTPFGDQIKQFFVSAQPGQRYPPELKLGPIVGDRLILLQGGDLMAIDVLSNETLWRNANAPSSGVIVSRGNQVALVSPTDNRVDYFDLLCGQKTGSNHWAHGSIWASSGPYVLCYSDSASGGLHQVQLVDPFDDQVVLEHASRAANDRRAAAPGGYGRVIDDRYLAMLASDGNAIVWDIREGREVANLQLAEQPDLQQLHVMIIGEQILLLSERRGTVSDQPATHRLMTQVAPDHVTVHAVHAISLADGSLSWGQEFSQPWGCTITQPPGTPLLLFSRMESVYRTNTSRRNTLGILALDVRDGSEAVPETARPVNTSHNSLQTRLTIDAPASQLVAKIGSETLTFSFGGSTEAKSQ